MLDPPQTIISEPVQKAAWPYLGLGAPLVSRRVQESGSCATVTAKGLLSTDVAPVALAVSTATRSPLFPNLPTIAEAGLPGFEYDQWYGLLVSAKTPRPLVNTLNKEVVRILALPDMKERFLTQGATPAPTTPEEFDRFIRSEVQRFAKVLIAAGARIN